MESILKNLRLLKKITEISLLKKAELDFNELRNN
jgi:hypothetical protein